MKNGLSYKGLGRFLGVNGSTVRSWEKAKPNHPQLN
jgi:DNA-binding transcriptional regulator YiaG